MCTLATMYWTFFKGAAIMAMVYPLFILVACKSDPLRAYCKGAPNQTPVSLVCMQELEVKFLGRTSGNRTVAYQFLRSALCSQYVS